MLGVADEQAVSGGYAGLLQWVRDIANLRRRLEKAQLATERLLHENARLQAANGQLRRQLHELRREVMHPDTVPAGEGAPVLDRRFGKTPTFDPWTMAQYRPLKPDAEGGSLFGQTARKMVDRVARKLVRLVA